MDVLCKFQAAFRGLRGRRHWRVVLLAVVCIQKSWKGHHWGRKPLRKKHECASRIQAVTRGMIYRELAKKRKSAAVSVQSHYQGHMARKRVKHMHAMGLRIQNNWRRFRAQVTVKQELF